MWPFRNRSRPHARFRDPCPGVGKKGDDLHMIGKDGWAVCPGCGRALPVRKHANRRHGWVKQTMLLHSRPRDEAKLTCWERWLNLPGGERR